MLDALHPNGSSDGEVGIGLITHQCPFWFSSHVKRETVPAVCTHTLTGEIRLKDNALGLELPW